MTEIHACTKSYGRKTVLRIPELRLEPGQIYAVIGANGSGKSTFARLVSGAERADRGARTVGGTAENKIHRFIGHEFPAFRTHIDAHTANAVRLLQILQGFRIVNRSVTQAFFDILHLIKETHSGTYP